MCGKKEAAGPLARDFDQTFLDSYLNQESWEKAESMLQTEAANLAIRKAGLQKQDINMVFAGDLLNQCISSTFGLRGMDIPFLGQYGACSTMAQTLIMASIMVECGAANYACAVTSSHFCTAERQFRTPLEYGSQRAPTAQWTATDSTTERALICPSCGHVIYPRIVPAVIVGICNDDKILVTKYRTGFAHYQSHQKTWVR